MTTTTNPRPQMTISSDRSEPVPETSYLTLPGGRIAYDVSGDGPLLVLVPGMGDLRDSYRFLAPALRQAGYRVACTDLRGHGDSDPGFASYGDVETAGDLIALIEELGSPAVLIGNSMAAGAWLFCRKYIECRKHILSTCRERFGNRSDTHLPHWPYCLNCHFGPTTRPWFL